MLNAHGNRQPASDKLARLASKNELPGKGGRIPASWFDRKGGRIPATTAPSTKTIHTRARCAPWLSGFCLGHYRWVKSGARPV